MAILMEHYYGNDTNGHYYGGFLDDISMGETIRWEKTKWFQWNSTIGYNSWSSIMASCNIFEKFPFTK